MVKVIAAVEIKRLDIAEGVNFLLAVSIRCVVMVMVMVAIRVLIMFMVFVVVTNARIATIMSSAHCIWLYVDKTRLKSCLLRGQGTASMEVIVCG